MDSKTTSAKTQFLIYWKDSVGLIEAKDAKELIYNLINDQYIQTSISVSIVNKVIGRIRLFIPDFCFKEPPKKILAEARDFFSPIDKLKGVFAFEYRTNPYLVLLPPDKRIKADNHIFQRKGKGRRFVLSWPAGELVSPESGDLVNETTITSFSVETLQKTLLDWGVDTNWVDVSFRDYLVGKLAMIDEVPVNYFWTAAPYYGISPAFQDFFDPRRDSPMLDDYKEKVNEAGEPLFRGDFYSSDTPCIDYIEEW